jgi:hypothetical protein
MTIGQRGSSRRRRIVIVLLLIGILIAVSRIHRIGIAGSASDRNRTG